MFKIQPKKLIAKSYKPKAISPARLNTVSRSGGQKLNRGMTYVELIVVLSIFSVITSIAIFNYGDFQAKVDIKNLTGDIALKVVEAQKSSLSGSLPASGSPYSTWNPSYGVYFDIEANNKSFIYFSDLDQDRELSNPSCAGVGECLEEVSITGGDFIASLEVFYTGGGSDELEDLTVTFERPNSGANFESSTPFSSSVSYAEITVSSSNASSLSAIKLYPSGRIQID